MDSLWNSYQEGKSHLEINEDPKKDPNQRLQCKEILAIEGIRSGIMEVNFH